MDDECIVGRVRPECGNGMGDSMGQQMRQERAMPCNVVPPLPLMKSTDMYESLPHHETMAHLFLPQIFGGGRQLRVGERQPGLHHQSSGVTRKCESPMSVNPPVSWKQSGMPFCTASCAAMHLTFSASRSFVVTARSLLVRT